MPNKYFRSIRYFIVAKKSFSSFQRQKSKIYHLSEINYNNESGRSCNTEKIVEKIQINCAVEQVVSKK